MFTSDAKMLYHPAMMPRTLLAAAVLLASSVTAVAQAAPHKWSIVVHGGAGVIERKSMPPQTEAAYRAAMQTALEPRAAVLDQSGTSLDAVEAAIQLPRRRPALQRGQGAVFTADGKNELDAAIMDGATLKAGAVARRHPHPESHLPRPRRHGKIPARHADRPRR